MMTDFKLEKHMTPNWKRNAMTIKPGKNPIRKFPDGTPVTCRVPGHPDCDFEGVVCGWLGSWGSGYSWYDVKRKRKVERFFGVYVKAK